VTLASSLTGARIASAAPAPSAPTEADTLLLQGAMELELTAGALYAVAAASLNDDVARSVAESFSANHNAYAEAIAGIAGLSADTRNEEVFAELEPSFGTPDVIVFATAGAQLEGTASATHTELVGALESTTGRTLSASILVIETRMSTVLTDLAGDGDDLDAMLGAQGEALPLAEVAE
jgi:hypothetical protein